MLNCYKTEFNQNVIDFESIEAAVLAKFYQYASNLGIHPTDFDTKDRKKLLLQYTFEILTEEYKRLGSYRQTIIYTNNTDNEIIECINRLLKVFPITYCYHLQSFNVFYKPITDGDKLEIYSLIRNTLSNLDNLKFNRKKQQEFSTKHGLKNFQF